MSKTGCIISHEGIEYLCGLIRDINGLDTNLIDDLNIKSNGTFSSVRINTLLNALKTDCNDYTFSLVSNLSRLELKIVTDEADIVDSNILYLYKPTGQTSYNQYVVIEGNKVLLGTTDINMSDYYTITQADIKFTLKTDFDALKTEVDKVKTTLGTKVNKTDIIDNLTSTDTDKPLSANQGKVLKDEIDLKANDDEVVKKTDIVDNLTSTDTDKPLSANQGKILNDKKVDKTSILTAISASPSDSNLLSEKAIKSELDKKSSITELNNLRQGILVTPTSMNKNILLWNVGHYYFNGNDIWKTYKHIPNTTYAPHVYVTSVKPVKYEDTNDKGTWFRQIKVDDHLGKSFIRTIYTANVKDVADLENGKLLSGDQCSDTGWQRICTTTSVADVPLTKIVFSDTTYYEVYNPDITTYEVVNGICYLQADVKVVNKYLTYNKVLDGIPRPKSQKNGMASPWNSNNNNANLLFEIRDGALFLAYGEPSQHHLINIAYPVA